MSRFASRRDTGDIAPRSNAPAPSRRGHTTFARLVGGLGMITLTALLFWLLTDDTFRVTDASVTFQGLRHANEDDVRARLSDIDRAPNVFRVRASDIVGELSELVEVDAAYASVTLPADVLVQLDERDPVFIWSDGGDDWLVDEDGMLFAPAAVIVEPDDLDAPDAPDGPDAATADDPDTESTDPDAVPAEVSPHELSARAALPVVEDARLPLEPPTVGHYLSTADLAVMRQLLALTPDVLGSKAESLHLRVDEHDGYVLESLDRGWSALFGRYTPSLQPPDVIPRQVQCLRWLLANEEPKLEQVRLVPSERYCGTFTKYDKKPAKGN